MWFAKSSCSQRSHCILTFGSVWFAKNSCSERSRCVLTFSSVWFVKNSCSQNLPWYNGTGWLGVKHQVTYLLFPKCTSDIVYLLVESSSLKCGCTVFITGHSWKWGFWDLISLIGVWFITCLFGGSVSLLKTAQGRTEKHFLSQRCHV